MTPAMLPGETGDERPQEPEVERKPDTWVVEVATGRVVRRRKPPAEATVDDALPCTPTTAEAAGPAAARQTCREPLGETAP